MYLLRKNNEITIIFITLSRYNMKHLFNCFYLVAKSSFLFFMLFSFAYAGTLISIGAEQIPLEKDDTKQYIGKWACKSSVFTNYANEYGKVTERACNSDYLEISISDSEEMVVKLGNGKEALLTSNSHGAFCDKERKISSIIPICLHIANNGAQLVLIDRLGGNHSLIKIFERIIE